jgi:DNA (cytosine-5)-methyltransferase 1
MTERITSTVSAQRGNGVDWDKNWIEVATELCRVDDGLPAKLDRLELSKSKHRENRLKALGNSIVPQVAIEIMQAIKQCDHIVCGAKIEC